MAYAISKLIEASRNNNTIDVQVYIERFDSHPHTSPYFILVCEPDKTITIEIAANMHVVPKLTVAEYDRMVELGWAKPRSGKDEDYGDFPNFDRNFPESMPNIEIAHHLLQALAEVYSMDDTSQIGLGSRKAANWLDEHRILQRMEHDGQPDTRHIFQRKGLGEQL